MYITLELSQELQELYLQFAKEQHITKEELMQKALAAYMQDRREQQIIDEHESTLKPKLTIDEQIKHMKQQGISFELCSEQKTREFLENHNYFFKIKSYAKNYEKHNGIYKNLDFAYLVEFSKLDMYLRRFILNLCLDVEHLLKVSLNAHFCNNSSEDGYQIVKDFLLENPNIKK